MTVDEGELRQRLESLRRELPEGARIVPFASVRARDRAEVRSGRVFDLGLASGAFAEPALGAFLELTHARLLLYRGFLGEAQVAHLLPRPATALQREAVVVVDEVDERGLAALLADDARGVRPRAVLTPAGLTAGIDALARALGVRAGALSPEVRLAEPASGLELLASTEALVLAGPALPDAAPMGLFFLGGDDLAHARARCRAMRALLRA